ncbi:MAG TPA: D-glucuronyl C5-epimerase family protein [Solirubrobacteraceae bacterium]|nr:D-glucuronyl C5-epimerase family protein [Solirubrobacteraceae bacterium]
MRRILPVLLTVAAAVVAWPADAGATPVIVLGRGGRVSVRDDPYVSATALTPAPEATSPGAGRLAGAAGAFAPAARAAAAGAFAPAARAATVSPGRRRAAGPGRDRPRARQITFFGALLGLYRSGRLAPGAYATAAASFRAALLEERRLTGARRSELEAVTETMHQIAASHQLTPSRLPAIEATLDANRLWWADGPMPAADQRVEFAGSQLVWQYYPGQGIQLQVLASFGKADALYAAGPAHYRQLVALLGQLIPLASDRAGSLAWEYWFHFDGGSPPWTSAMSQATALEALSRAYLATGDSWYLSVADQALPLFTRPPPAGVAVKTPLGVRFLQYTFAPGEAILNAFLQALIGLHAFAQASGNPLAAALFSAGNAEAQAEVPAYNTGAWSLYAPGVEDTLGYHELVTGLLSELCSLTSAPVYCTTASDFQADLHTPPVLEQLTVSARARSPFALRFRLSKYSHVGIVVTLGSRTVLETSGWFAYGVNAFLIPPLRAPGLYGVRIAATDLAGNFARIAGALSVRPAPRPARSRPARSRPGRRARSARRA